MEPTLELESKNLQALSLHLPVWLWGKGNISFIHLCFPYPSLPAPSSPKFSGVLGGWKSQTWPHQCISLQQALEVAAGAGKSSALWGQRPLSPLRSIFPFPLLSLGEEFCPWELSQVPTAPLTFPCLPNTFLHLNQSWSMFHSLATLPAMSSDWWTINLQQLLIFPPQKPPNTLLLGVNDLPNSTGARTCSPLRETSHVHVDSDYDDTELFQTRKNTS